ncbi:metallopeptidase precursor [Zea mays]|uniref:allantoate deiminase n=2 Tax=Zea mays TaxID=4577 RepID=B4FA57_MAIZE|nr:metallopeptidase precursor [Zea mays]ACF79000.1 unknown [Zea mays]ACF86140.1 unknown [Zea mays]ACG42112.1 metallopeptidase [Zea mays]AQL05237.1 Allantoate deiminase [Zea mays]|eukprot:NP_001151245.1 metallopeptidase precursor [Zea mays]
MAPSSLRPPRHHPSPLVVLAIAVLLVLRTADGLPEAGGGGGGGGLYREILRDETVQRLKELGKISDGDGYLERTFLSPASIRATGVIVSWMKDAGLTTWVDQMGNIHGRYEPANSTRDALLIGSHMDTVVDAGMYDGALGIISAISALKVLKVTGKLQRLTRPVEVIAFSDEEGIRFQTTFLGSAAVAGTLPESILQVSDKSGTTLQDVLKMNSFEATSTAISQARYNPESVGSYVEVHMEQGPVLEALHYPLGVVKGIAGQTRLKVIVDGSQGHAGTVPMKLRRDPMVAAAELVVTLERLCKEPNSLLTYDEECSCFTEESLAGLVCTVGELNTWPSASNVIPGQVNFTVDIRAMDDQVRETIVTSFSRLVLQKCDDRLVDCKVEHKHSAAATHCDPELTSQLKRAARSTVSAMPGRTVAAGETPVLMSGAGHDAMAMARLTKIGMLFVRCRGGISHSPEESVMDNDVWAAGLALFNFIDQNAVSEELDAGQNVVAVALAVAES